MVQLSSEIYHGGRIFTRTQQEILDHNERVKKTIPQDQLLIYEIKEGWQPLVEFLGVYVITDTKGCRIVGLISIRYLGQPETDSPVPPCQRHSGVPGNHDEKGSRVPLHSKSIVVYVGGLLASKYTLFRLQ